MTKPLGLIQRIGLRLAGIPSSEYTQKINESQDLELKSVRSFELLSTSQDNKASWTDWSEERAVQKGYNANYIVNACVGVIIEAFSSVPWRVLARKGDKWEPAPEHPLQFLIDKPNNFMPRRLIFEWMAGHLVLGGNAVFTKVRTTEDTSGTVLEWWPHHPDNVKVFPSRTDYISKYQIKNGNNVRDIPPEDVIHIKRTGLDTLYWGTGQLVAGSKILDLDNAMLDWQKVTLQNRAIIPGILGVKNKLSDMQWKELRKQMDERRAGGSNAGKDLILGSDLTYSRVGANSQEMDWINSRKLSAIDLCVLFRVPPPMIGIYDQATLSNIETARKIFWQDRIIPMLASVEDALNLAFVSEFDDFENLWLTTDLTGVPALRANQKENITSFAVLVKHGVKPRAANQLLEIGLQDEDLVEGFLNNAGANQSGVPALPSSSTGIETSSIRFNRILKQLGNKRISFIKSSLSEEKKEILWKMRDSERQEFEEKTAKQFRKLFKDESDMVVSAFKNSGSESDEQVKAVLSVITKNKKVWSASLQSAYKVTVKHFGVREIARLQEEEKSYNGFSILQKEDISFVLDNDVGKWIKDTVANKVTLISDTTRDKLKTLIVNGAKAGDTAEQVALDLIKLYNAWETVDTSAITLSRAFMIARTEIGSAVSYGIFEGGRQLGEALDSEMGSTWISSRDDRVRESHDSIDGETITLGEIFSNGLQFPNDPIGEAREVINCRCVVQNFLIS